LSALPKFSDKVQKHLESIFAKLGVTTRTAAAVKALECLGAEEAG
jgi:DNA-binding CsgD family transcriptional regulator